MSKWARHFRDAATHAIFEDALRALRAIRIANTLVAALLARKPGFVTTEVGDAEERRGAICVGAASGIDAGAYGSAAATDLMGTAIGVMVASEATLIGNVAGHEFCEWVVFPESDAVPVRLRGAVQVAGAFVEVCVR